MHPHVLHSHSLSLSPSFHPSSSCAHCLSLNFFPPLSLSFCFSLPISLNLSLALYLSFLLSLYLCIYFHLSSSDTHCLSLTLSLLRCNIPLLRLFIRALSIVEKVRDALRERLSEVPWMSDGTRTEAMKKMESFKVKIGFPDKWIDYSTLTVLKGENLLNFFASNRFSFVLDLNR